MAFGLGARAFARVALAAGVGPVALTMGAIGAMAGYGFTGQTYQQRLETYKVLMMGAGVAYPPPCPSRARLGRCRLPWLVVEPRRLCWTV